MPTAHGFDEMHNTTLYHLNAYTYTDPTFNPDFPFDDAETMAMWGNVIGAVEGKAGEQWREVEKLDAAKIPFIDEKSVDHRRRLPRGPRRWRRTVLPVPEHRQDAPAEPARTRTSSGSSMAKSKYLDSLVELDHHVGVVVDKVRELGIEREHADRSGRPTTAPGRTCTPTVGTHRSRAPRAPTTKAAAGCRRSRGGRARSSAGRRNSEIVGSLDFMATFASLAGARAADGGPRRRADDLRQLRPDRAADR